MKTFQKLKNNEKIYKIKYKKSAYLSVKITLYYCYFDNTIYNIYVR